MIINNSSATNFGMAKRTVSLATRAKISAARKGQSPSPETRAKLSAALTGIKRSDETRQKVSDAMKRVRAEHPEITEMHRNALTSMWRELADTRKSMRNFFTEQPVATKKTIVAKKQHKTITANGETVDGTFFRDYWETHAEQKIPFRTASQKAYAKLKNN